MNIYQLKADRQKEWETVTREQWIRAERNAGFRPKIGNGEATSSFGGHGMRGRIIYAKD